MQERIDLIKLLLSLTEDQLEMVLTLAAQEPGLLSTGGDEPCHQTGI